MSGYGVMGDIVYKPTKYLGAYAQGRYGTMYGQMSYDVSGGLRATW